MSVSVEKKSFCKVNLLLNILSRRQDGFHELETVMQPVNFCDRLTLTRGGQGVQLTCSDSRLPTDARNLVHRAATAFLRTAGVSEGVKAHLEKKIPLAAGLGGGSGNAAATLLGMNELFGGALGPEQLRGIAAELGSDVPFFLQTKPALATGRGENVKPLEPFPALKGAAILLIHPGFGISTAWAYQALRRFPAALNGASGRAQKLIKVLETGGVAAAGGEFYNSLEAPALEKYPLLVLFQQFLRTNGAAATLMSGSGSTTFAVARNLGAAEELAEKVKEKFWKDCWTAAVPV